MRSLSRTLAVLGLLSIFCGGLTADARASTGRMWVGSLNSGVWTSDASAIPEEILVALIEGDIGISIAFDSTTARGNGADHNRTIPLPQLESFFSHNVLTGVLFEAHTGEFPGTLLYLPDEELWSDLDAPDALTRFSDVLSAAAVLLAHAELPYVDGLAPFAMELADGNRGPLEIFFLADGYPADDGWSPFTLEVISTQPLRVDDERLFSSDTYTFLDPSGFMDDPLIASKPDFGVRTPLANYEVWLYPAVTEDEWLESQTTLKDMVGLWSTDPLAPVRGHHR